jgi:hypothetical protein
MIWKTKKERAKKEKAVSMKKPPAQSNFTSALKSGPVSVLGPPGLEQRTGAVLLYSRMSKSQTGTEENRKKPV